jgi:hypothetical protein
MSTDIDRCSIAFSGESCCTAVKLHAGSTDQAGMEFKHACSFCGWERVSPTPVMLSPSCERCGCALDASAVAAAAPVFERAMPAPAMLLLRVLGVVLGALALYAATKVGLDSAGPSGALVAFGMGWFLIVPFVPQRLGGRGR